MVGGARVRGGPRDRDGAGVRPACGRRNTRVAEAEPACGRSDTRVAEASPTAFSRALAMPTRCAPVTIAAGVTLTRALSSMRLNGPIGYAEVMANLCGCVHVRSNGAGGCAFVVTVHSWCICVLRSVAW